MPIPSSNDGLEQEAFETFAKADKMNMQTHPLHWLFLDPKTYAARQGWKAALEYVTEQTQDLGWKLIDDIQPGARYEPGLLLYSATLIDEDFNPDGIVEGHWIDDIGWQASVWCGYHDTFETRVIVPTHFMLKPKRPQ